MLASTPAWSQAIPAPSAPITQRERDHATFILLNYADPRITPEESNRILTQMENRLALQPADRTALRTAFGDFVKELLVIRADLQRLLSQRPPDLQARSSELILRRQALVDKHMAALFLRLTPAASSNQRWFLGQPDRTWRDAEKVAYPIPQGLK